MELEGGCCGNEGDVEDFGGHAGEVFSFWGFEEVIQEGGVYP